uniref:Mariner Mos1 transposase n=1 Tax=Caenorhabditis japonica TaxID=281687 RepID=A0A8R1I9S1_CAEJA
MVETRGVSMPKGELDPKKVLLCIWWNVKGRVHWEFLPTNTTVTSDLYCKQLATVAEQIKGKLKRVYFLHDNARPLYYPDMIPTDDNLFRTLSHFLNRREFHNEVDLKTSLQSIL